ncbi:MAG TPA: hypothetical protein VN670_10240 [Acidobacteriaceae bacterium]|nr:hypothetical protein [Acidobacteriaceae bacterium]
MLPDMVLPLIASENQFSKARQTVAAFLLLSLALTAWLWMHAAERTENSGVRQDIVFNPGYQHCHRLQVATARAAMDALGMRAENPSNDYQTDYHRQRMQIQADSEGLDRWAIHDPRHQGLLLEIRASLAGLRMALDQMTGDAAVSSGIAPIPMLPALNRVQSALSNYSASVSQPENLHAGHYLFAPPVRLWWLLLLTLVEIAALAWLIFSPSRRKPINVN